MHRAVKVMIVSGFAFCGVALGGILPFGPMVKPAMAAERSGLAARSAFLASTGPSGGPSRPMTGFDTCQAPSLRTMRVWRARFSATGIYIGGENRACGYGNLSRTWVQSVKVMGWSLLPNYVGPQPPCDSFRGRINPGKAAAQGRSAAGWAIANARTLGIGTGSPIYYDMEAYNDTKGRCVTAVLVFLDAWTRQLNAEGYVSGVYSSEDAAIADLQTISRIDGHKLAKPQCVWIALWDHQKNMSGPSYAARSGWPAGMRSKQYAGPRWVKVGGIRLNIDADLVDGPVVRDRPPAPHKLHELHERHKRHKLRAR
jgi:Domain of unknown function (DUF1906)